MKNYMLLSFMLLGAPLAAHAASLSCDKRIETAGGLVDISSGPVNSQPMDANGRAVISKLSLRPTNEPIPSLDQANYSASIRNGQVSITLETGAVDGAPMAKALGKQKTTLVLFADKFFNQVIITCKQILE